MEDHHSLANHILNSTSETTDIFNNNNNTEITRNGLENYNIPVKDEQEPPKNNDVVSEDPETPIEPTQPTQRTRPSSYSCYHIGCNYHTDNEQEYRNHGGNKHTKNPLLFPSKFEIEKYGLKAQGKEWEV